MKIKKIVASVAAAAVAVSTMAAMSVSAVTEGTVVDFEDGDYSFVHLNADDAGSDQSTFSVVDYNGSKQLQIDVQDKSKTPKVWFYLKEMMPAENIPLIKRITFDMTIVPKSEEGVIGWVGGAFAGAGGVNANLGGNGQKNPEWNQSSWEGGAYDPGAVVSISMERKLLMANQQYKEDSEQPFFGLMKWAASEPTDGSYECDQYYIYVDNIKFYDSLTGGNELTVGVAAASEEETTAESTEETTEAATEAATEAPEEEADEAVDVEEEVDEDVEEDAAPAETEAPAETTVVVATTAAAADNTTTSTGTGNVAVASIAGVMALAGVAAIATKKRK